MTSGSWYEIESPDAQKVDIGFDFYFNEKPYSSIYIYEDGYFNFTDYARCFWLRTCFPDPGLPNAVVALFATGLKMFSPKVGCQTFGSAPNRYFVIEYRNIYDEDPGPGGYYNDTGTFEAVFFEGSNEILFQYKDVILDSTWGRATIGVEDENGTLGTEYACYGNPKINNELAILFYYTNLLTMTPTQTATPTPTSSQTQTITKTSTLTATPTGTFFDYKPILKDGQVDPISGYQSTEFEYSVYYKDPDGGSPPVKRVYINGVYKSMTLKSGSTSDGWYNYCISGYDLNLGQNEFYFFFTDFNFSGQTCF